MRKEKQKGKEMEEKRDFFYIICWYSLYYFNELCVKIKIGMLGKV